ncbi:MAG: amino acid adenylation domain-containing protein, partial [Gammaproteobacteria bacterium]
AELAPQYVAPRTDTETQLAQIWAEVLRVERIGIHDNFFALGGNSLLTMTLIERMRRQGLKVDVRTLFVTPTVAGLAAAVGGRRVVEVPPNRIPPRCEAIIPEMLPLVALGQGEIDHIIGQVPGGLGNVHDIYPLAPLQDGILFHHLMAAEGDPYLLPSLLAFDMRKRLDEFVSALQAVIDRHDILRTAVVWEGLPDPVQVVWREAPLVVEDLTFDAEAGDTAAQLRARLDPQRFRLDVRQAPLVRAFMAHDAVHERWLLLLLSHHLAIDHRTLEILLEEIQAHLLGQTERLPAPIPFRNFVAQARLGVSSEEHERFFREMLGEVDEPTAPFGLLDVRGDGSGIEQAQRDLDPNLARRLRACARTLGVSVASLCHLAFAGVLARVSGRMDVVLGTVLFGRLQGGEGADRVPGMFINTLPLRIKLGEEGVEEAVRRTHGLLGELLHHEHAALALVQRCSAVPAPAPLFSALFNYRYSREDDPAAPAEATRGWEGIELLDSEERTNYPLSMDVDDLGKGFRLTAQVQSPIEPQRLCGYMHTALKGIIDALETAPDSPVQAIDVLPELERRQLLIEWNAMAAEYAQEQCIHQLFEAQVERAPEVVAVLFEGVRVCYRELNARANRIAWGLKARGIGAESVVAIASPRSLEQVLAVLGILKAGAAYLPLDPEQPRARWAQMIEDARPCALLVAARWRDRFLQEESDCISLDAMMTAFAGQCEEDPGTAIAADNLAYVLYTSGSTGRPKGAAITHRGLSNRVRWGIARFGWGPDDVILYRTALGFDVAAWELFGALAAGARLVIASAEVGRDPQALVELIRSQGITWLEVVPALLQALLETPDFGACRTLRGIGCGGESLSPALLTQYRSLLSVPLYNFYGPTEATIDTTLWGSTEAINTSTVPIGRPIGNTRIYILDRWVKPVPVGVVGELYIGGVGLARGYLHRAGSTAERWVPDPFGPAGSRLYRTGDLARYRPDGNIEFLGRIDHQVKLRGYRIELGEIEARLGAHPQIREVCVLLRQDPMEEKRLVAYVVCRETVTGDRLRSYLKEALPEYMIPAAFVFLDPLPLTPNGKVDRKSLPAPNSAEPLKHPYVAPRTPAEVMLAGIWAEVLGVSRVGIHDNFFALGGHSLLATRVMSRVCRSCELPLRALFESPTVAQLALAMEAARTGDMRLKGPPLVAVSRTGDLPLSHAQQRLWFLDQLEPGGTAYNMPGALRLVGRLDQVAFERAMHEIVRRHEVLRTIFVTVQGQPVQLIAPELQLPIPVVGLADLDEAAREAEVRRLAAEEAGRGFDLSTGPLIRLRLLYLGGSSQTGEAEHVVLFTLHHIVSDGWSEGILVRELMALYEAFCEGEGSPLPEPAIQYADYAVWQRKWLAGEVLERQLEYWRGQLAGVPAVLELPTDRPRPALRSYQGANYGFSVPKALTERLYALSQQAGVTLFMTLLAAFKVLLYRYSGRRDLCVGTPIANRTRVEVEDLIGFFVNTLVLRTQLSGNLSFTELLGQVREVCLGAQAHQDLPFERLVEELRPLRDMRHSPLFQVMFTLQNVPAREREIGGLRISSVETDSQASQFDLSVDVIEAEEGLEVRLEYCTDLFDAGTIVRLASHYEKLLSEIPNQPEARISELPLIPDDERHRLVDPLPLTPNGKVDRKSLPAPNSAEPLADPYVAPRTPAEVMLAGLWAEVLGVSRVGIHDNFFALGGHSLMAVGLMQKIRERLHTNLSLVTLFQAPTVAELALHIESEARVEATSTSLIFLRRGTIRPPLCCIHTGTGHARDYQPLISALGGDRIVYGIQMPAFLDPTVPTRSMNSLAGEYAELLLKHAAEQPFFILGWSLGGLIALSVAAKLEQKGAQIGFLGILDTEIPRSSGDSWIERFTPYLHDSAERGRLQGLTASERHALETELKLLPPEEHPAYLARWGQERGYWFKDASPELLRLESLLWRHTEVVEDSFALPHLDAPLHVWWASGSLDAEGRRPTEWSVCTHKTVVEHVVDGDHGSLIRSPRLHHEIRQAIDTVGRVTSA